jgi:hypothetical protein
MSWRTRGRLVTIPVPRGKLRASVNSHAVVRLSPPLFPVGVRTNLARRCSQALSSSLMTASPPPQSAADLSGFAPVALMVSFRTAYSSLLGALTPTVVNTSCSLLTSVMSPGSLTLMLFPVSIRGPRSEIITCSRVGIRSHGGLPVGSSLVIVHDLQNSCSGKNDGGTFGKTKSTVALGMVESAGSWLSWSLWVSSHLPR